LYFLILMVMLSMILIIDLSAILLETKDNAIILPCPVNDRTVLVSRLLHIFIHLVLFIIPMVLPVLVYILLTNGLISLLVFSVLCAITVLITAFLINLVYLFILKTTTPSRFKNLINYIQIIFVVLIFGGYEFLLNGLDVQSMSKFQIEQYDWAFYIPIVWIASLWKTLVLHEFSF